MEPDGTTVYIVYPPPDDSEESSSSPEDLRKISERTGKRSWSIRDFGRFQERTWLARESALLKWAGQYRDAANRDTRLEVGRLPAQPPDNVPLQTRQTEFGSFRGQRYSLFPELGRPNLGIFRGVEEELLAAVMESRGMAREIAHFVEHRFGAHEPAQRPNRSPFGSVSRNGTCMIVDGLE